LRNSPLEAEKGRLYLLGFAGLCYFYPKQVAQWAFATIAAFIGAYLTTGGKLAPFEAWFVVEYIIIMWLFSLLNRKQKA
jgi:hypothetical protein